MLRAVSLLIPSVLICALLCGGVTTGRTAWTILETGTHDKSSQTRLQATSALGLLSGNAQAARLAELALDDTDSGVRRAAATALGNMGAKESVPKLKALLAHADGRMVVTIAAVLEKFNDPEAYEIYYEILTGQRKAGGSILDGIKDKKSLETMGVEEAFGFVPFSGIGLGAYNYFRQNDKSSENVDVVAAAALAHDKDSQAGKALVQAAFAGKGVVQAAALRALAERGDPAVIPAIAPAMYSDKLPIKYLAAAVIVHLGSIRERHTA